MRVRFGDCVFDADARSLARGEDQVALSPKAFALLELLIENRPRALSKDQLHARIWPATFVSDDSLARLITEIRAALGDDARSPRFVRTVHAFGYAFVGTALDIAEPHAPLEASTAVWILWGSREIRLREGENLIGRDVDAVVRVDSPTVSRQHARISVLRTAATIEDLQSKNGTYVRNERIDAVTALGDGDQIQVGDFVLTFRAALLLPSTQTRVGVNRDSAR